jgi:hypothetical protein
MIRKLTLLFAAALLCAGIAIADSNVAVNTHKLTAGTGVRVRATPSTSAAETGKLGIGTDLTITQRTASKSKVGAQSDYWYQASAPVKGWVFGSLLRDFDPAQPESAWLALALEKLGKSDVMYDAYDHRSPLSFGDAVEISDFAKRAAAGSKTPAVQGELELAYWRAVQIALTSGDMDSHEKPPYSTWKKKFGEDVIYSEPSAEYLINPDVLWKLADKHKADASGDVIAWQAANAYVGGECEGDISCYSARTQMMQGAYLKRYPHGKYVEQALTSVNDTLDSMKKEWKDYPADLKKDVDLKEWASILGALADSAAANKARQSLKALQAMH